MTAAIPLVFAYWSVFAYSCLDALLGYLTNILGIPVYGVICVRTSAMVLLSLTYLYLTNSALQGSPKIRHLVWIRGVLLAVGLFTGYSSLHYLSVSEFLTLFCLTPIVTGLMCWIFVGEPFTLTHAACCLTSFFGVVLITDPFGRMSPEAGESGSHPSWALDDRLPTTFSSKLIGLALCLPNIFCKAAEMTLMRVIKDQASTMQIMLIISLCPATSMAVLLAAKPNAVVIPGALSEWVALLGVIPIGLSAMYTQTYASQWISGTQVTIADYSGVLFGTLIQWVLYGNHPGPVATVGMAVIVGSGLYAILWGDKKAKTDLERNNDDAEMEELLDRPDGIDITECDNGRMA